MPTRRHLLHSGAALGALSLPLGALAEERRFSPGQGGWRTFELTTRVEPAMAQGAHQVWVPIPSVNTDWQRSLESRFSTNGEARRTADGVDGARMLNVSFGGAEQQPFVEVTTRVQTRDRGVDGSRPGSAKDDPATLAAALRPTQLLPTDGIVRTTAREVRA